MDESLPYVAAAFFCDRVIEDKEGIISAIRIVDNYRISMALGSNDPTLQKMFSDKKVLPTMQATMFLSLKSGPFKGTAKIVIIGQRPSGQRKQLHTFDADLKGGHVGANFILNMGITLVEDGLYWFDVMFNDRLLTKMPCTFERVQELAKDGTPETP